MEGNMDKADEKEAIRLYDECRWTLRQVAERFGTNHHMISRIMARNGVETTTKGRRRIFSEEHKRKIGEAHRGLPGWNTGQKMDEASRRKNMKGRLGTEIDLDRYPDYEKLLFLSRLSSKHKQYHGMSDESRKAFFDKFYFDDAFNAVFAAWKAQGKNKWWYPSLDHIDPRANGGTFDLDNLQILTWFENRAKADMLPGEWEAFKKATGTRSALFIEEILGNST